MLKCSVFLQYRVWGVNGRDCGLSLASGLSSGQRLCVVLSPCCRQAENIFDSFQVSYCQRLHPDLDPVCRQSRVWWCLHGKGQSYLGTPDFSMRGNNVSYTPGCLQGRQPPTWFLCVWSTEILDCLQLMVFAGHSHLDCSSHLQGRGHFYTQTLCICKENITACCQHLYSS
jgi:hypothetical protein